MACGSSEEHILTHYKTLLVNTLTKIQKVTCTPTPETLDSIELNWTQLDLKDVRLDSDNL